MRLLIVVPVLSSLERTKPFWGLLANTCKSSDLLVIDNAPDENEQRFWKDFVAARWIGEMYYAPQKDNLGLIKSFQYAYEEYPNYDIYAYIHNDLYVYQDDWDQIVVDRFKINSQLGLFGFFGGEGVGPGGGRMNVWSNMLEAEIHGWRTTGLKQVAVLDGMALIASRKMLDVRGGVDLSYDIHHFYDLDLSLESIDRGFENWIAGIPIHHHSGQTACLPQFNDWANRYVGEHLGLQGSQGQDLLYQKNRSRFNDKWGHKLPWKVGMPWPK